MTGDLSPRSRSAYGSESLSAASPSAASQQFAADHLGAFNTELGSRTISMALLPSLRRGSDRWWLPRSTVATDAIGLILLAHAKNRPLDPVSRNVIHQALISDPSLMIFAALTWPEESVDSMTLVDWLADQLPGRLASGDAYLGAPSIHPSMVKRWHKLGTYYRTLPVERWMDDAHLWLETAGPAVSAAWRQQWPALSAEPSALAPTDESQGMLQQLARVAQQHRALQTAFDGRLHQSKLAALKQLAYGLSHEINNPLANISTRAQQLQRGETDSGRQATLQRIVDQVYRAHEMIADLMFYANPPPTDVSECDLRSVVHEVVSSFNDEFERQSIRVDLSQPNQPVTVSVDRQMIAEAARALIRNAVEAIGCQGTIIVSLVQSDDQALIHIADSGPGLSEDAKAHAFDPYFSGREAGRGLGLGLCRAYRITKLHDGEITLAGGPAGCVATIALRRLAT